MNTYLLGLISKWATIITVSATGLFNSTPLFSEEKTIVENTNQAKNSIIQVTTIDNKTETIYNNKLPRDISITKKEGHTGLAYKDSNDNIIEVIKEPENAVIEVGTGDEGKYIGKMTGYGADCQGCTGNISCKTKKGTNWNLNSNGINYNDDQFGNVRIIAAALEKFPCGTIIEVKNANLGTFNTIVLDTGGSMINAYKNGVIHIDLAFISETNSEIYKATNSNVEYNVKRWGW